MTAGAPVQGVGVGAAPVGVIAICRPGVLEDEKTDKLRTRMFPISNKKQQRFYSSNQGNRGFMSLLRPIDDELSLTATASNDENDNDNDNSDGEEYTDQEQGQSSPTSRYPSSKKGGGAQGGTHLPEFSSGEHNLNSNSRQVQRSNRYRRKATIEIINH